MAYAYKTCRIFLCFTILGGLFLISLSAMARNYPFIDETSFWGIQLDYNHWPAPQGATHISTQPVGIGLSLGHRWPRSFYATWFGWEFDLDYLGQQSFTYQGRGASARYTQATMYFTLNQFISSRFDLHLKAGPGFQYINTHGSKPLSHVYSLNASLAGGASYYVTDQSELSLDYIHTLGKGSGSILQGSSDISQIDTLELGWKYHF